MERCTHNVKEIDVGYFIETALVDNDDGHTMYLCLYTKVVPQILDLQV